MRLPAFLLLLSGLIAIPASAAPLILGGGTTTVDLVPGVVQTLTDAGLTVSPLGTATLAGVTATFPITGGMIDTDTEMAEIFHNGSGLRFASGTEMLDLLNFVITASVTPGSESGLLTGEVLGTPGVPLFDIGPGLQLSLRSEAAGALTNVFGLPDLTGTVIGTAAAAPEPVPEPSTFALLAVGGLAVAGFRRMKSAARA